MFNGKQLDNIHERLILMTELIINLDKRMIELKMLTLENRKYTMQNKAAIQKEKGETKIIEVIKEVPQVRKHKRKALRTSKGWTMISQEEKLEFMNLYNQGLTMMEISQSTGRSVSAISRYLHGKLDGTEPTEDGHH